MSRHLPILLTLICLLTSALPADAGLNARQKALLEGSISRARQTSAIKPTTQMVMDKVEEAARLVAEFGPESFDEFKGADSDFIYAGTYVWIHSAKSGVMLMHPMIPTLEGQNVLFMRDKTGKMMFVAFNRTALEKGSGW
jgi:signal transduction histidine kinase